MNVKPGDLAIVVSSKPMYMGRIVEVLAAAPNERFTLPDGYPHQVPDEQPSWVIKLVGGPALAPCGYGRHRQAWYGVGADRNLRPLPGSTEEAEEDEPTEVCAGGSPP